MDIAVAKLETRLRRSHDRHRVHHGRHQPISVAEATAPLAASLPAEHDAESDGEPESVAPDGGPGRIVRIKEHHAEPMTVEQALEEMELVGHDFYLFVDTASGRPSVVYRRIGFDYGLLQLSTVAGPSQDLTHHPSHPQC